MAVASLVAYRHAAEVLHSKTFRISMSLIVLMATFYIAANLQANSQAQLENAQHTDITVESTQAPNQALVPTKSDISSDNSAQTSVSSQSTSSNTSINAQQSSTESSVSVNGKNVPLKKNGTVHKVIRTNGSKTTLDISTQSNTSTSTDSSLDISLESSSETVTER